MIIGLMGYAQSGKDTIASILCSEHGYTRIAFADKIRELLYDVNPMVGCSPSGYLQDLVNLVGWDQAKQEPQVRRLLQDLGVGARKTFGDMFWVQQALRQVHFEGNFVITDVRFPNEAKAIKTYDNSLLWRIERIGVDAVNDHISETALKDYPSDHTFINNGTIDDLKFMLKTRMRDYL
jgi:hypothetical protein